jgi:calcium channel MID1
VDRACPVFLGFRCPLRGDTANESYAFIGDDDDKGDGSEGSGDKWGNRWCNG